MPGYPCCCEPGLNCFICQDGTVKDQYDITLPNFTGNESCSAAGCTAISNSVVRVTKVAETATECRWEFQFTAGGDCDLDKLTMTISNTGTLDILLDTTGTGNGIQRWRKSYTVPPLVDCDFTNETIGAVQIIPSSDAICMGFPPVATVNGV